MPSPRMFICALMSQTSLTGPRLIPMRAERMSGGSEAMFLRTAIPTERASSGSPRKAIAAPSPVSSTMKSRGGTGSSAREELVEHLLRVLLVADRVLRIVDDVQEH